MGRPKIPTLVSSLQHHKMTGRTVSQGSLPPRFQGLSLQMSPTWNKDATQVGREGPFRRGAELSLSISGPLRVLRAAGQHTPEHLWTERKGLWFLLICRISGTPCFTGLGRGQSVGTVKTATLPCSPSPAAGPPQGLSQCLLADEVT